MGDSSDLSRFSTPIGLVIHPRRELIARLWPNTSLWRRTSCGESALVYDLRALSDALKLIAPSMDSSWLLSIAKRMAAAAPSRRTKYHLITSDRLYLLGLELMDRAVAEVNPAHRVTKAQAFRYRSGAVLLGPCALDNIWSRLVIYGRLTYRLRIQRADGRWTIRFPERSRSASICI
jgi:hypothetical protein